MHLIGAHDIQYGLARLGQAWHGLSTLVETLDTLTVSDKFLYPMALRPLTFSGPDGEQIPTDSRQIVSLDNNLPIGPAVGQRYQLIGNAEIWEAIAKALIGTRHEIVTAGTVRDRELAFVSIKLAETFTDGKGNESQPYLNIQWGHGGKTSIFVVNVATKIVCANTYQMSLAGEKLFKMKHYQSACVDAISEAIDSHFGVAAEFHLAMQRAESMEVGQTEAREVFTGFLSGGTLAKTKQGETQLGNKVDRLESLFYDGKGNSGASRLDVFHAVTDYYTHESAGTAKDGEDSDVTQRRIEKQYVASEFGRAADKKNEMLAIVTGSRTDGEGWNDKAWSRTREAGEKVLLNLPSVLS
mgnify:CR=1 FL=1